MQGGQGELSRLVRLPCLSRLVCLAFTHFPPVSCAAVGPACAVATMQPRMTAHVTLRLCWVFFSSAVHQAGAGLGARLPRMTETAEYKRALRFRLVPASS